MNAKELYALPSESESLDLDCLVTYCYNHLKEVNEDYFEVVGNTKIVVKTLKEFDFDSRRFWALRTVWFENKPVMIVQNAGREGSDHCTRYITDEKSYKEMVSYIKSKVVEGDYKIENFLDENKELESLDNFYGNKIDDYFERYYD